MSDTKQLAILKAITTLLEGITPANGYDYDLTGKVYRGKVVFGDSEVPPFVTILESLRPDAQPMAAGVEKMVREEEWELLVQGWAITTQANPIDALYGLKGAIEKRLSRMIATDNLGDPVAPLNFWLGGLITGARIGPGVVRAQTPQTAGKEALYLPVVICYVADVSDPWDLS